MKKATILLASMFFSFVTMNTTMDVHAQHRADIVETAVSAGSFNTLATALTEAGLVNTLKGNGPFTVFAPTDEAFAKLPKGTVESLLKSENRDQLIAILTYHVVKDRVRAEEVAMLSSAGTVNGQRVNVAVEDGKIFINDATVTSADIRASNGIIHVIDQVLIPETRTIPEVAKEAKAFNTLLAAVRAAGLSEALSGEGPFTVFAPNDAAFDKLPEGTVASLLKPENRDQLQRILKYHVTEGRIYSTDFFRNRRVNTLEGDRVQLTYDDSAFQINESNVLAADIEAANGVVHVIDAVLLPDADETAAARASDVLELAIERGVPLFNNGQQSACAAIYEVAATSVLAMTTVSEAAKKPLRAALREMKTTHNSGKKAWILREGLDKSLNAMENDRMTASR